MKKRTKSLIVGTVAVLAISTAGISWALFSETVVANATGGQGADLQAPTVPAESISYVYDSTDGLYPGHNADVKLTVVNPNNVDVTISSLTNTAKTVTNVGANTLYCEGALQVVTTPGGVAGTTIPANGQVQLTLTDAVALHVDTDNRCQDMDFATAWTVAIANT